MSAALGPVVVTGKELELLEAAHRRLLEAEAEADVRDFLRKFYYGICGDAPPGTWPLPRPEHASTRLCC